jgi:hypothetical protein
MDKMEVARRQLGTALALFLDDRDSASVHCLACGGGEIAEHLSRKAGVEPFFAHIVLEHSPKLSEADLRSTRNAYWNAFKHAKTKKDRDRDDAALLSTFSDAENDHILFMGWLDYSRAAGSMPIEAQAFQAWYFAMYPEKVGPDLQVVKASIVMFGNDLSSVARSDAKRRLKIVIAHYSKREDVLSLKLTDRRPLDLGSV